MGIELRSGEEEEREDNVNEVERGNSTISDRGWKVARSGQGGESICRECQCQEVEDVCHWLIQCPARDHLRQPLMTEANRWVRFEEQSHSEQTAIVLSLACADPRILKHLSSMWCARFVV